MAENRGPWPRDVSRVCDGGLVRLVPRIASCFVATELFLQTLDEFRFHDFAERVARQVVYDDDATGDLIAGDALLGPGAKFVFGRNMYALLRDHGGDDEVSPFFVGQPHNGDLRDCFVLSKEVLDFDSAQLVSATLENVDGCAPE